MIPKIIHQTAPIDKLKWHPIWHECQQSWLKSFPNFNYIFWNDEDIRNLIQNQYPQFLKEYDSWPYHIMRVDFARFCILHSCGGIYADMDMYCYTNFYDSLSEKDVYLVESWPEWDEKIQNSLMISTQQHPFWMMCCEETVKNVKKISQTEVVNDYNKFVLNSMGPQYLSKLITDDIGILPKEKFNPVVDYQFNWIQKNNVENPKYQKTLDYFNQTNQTNTTVITRHYLTGNWPN